MAFLVSIMFDKTKVSAEKILHIGIVPSGESFIHIKNKRRPNTDPCDTAEFIFLRSEF